MHNKISPCGHDILYLRAVAARNIPKTQRYIECALCHKGSWEDIVVEHDTQATGQIRLKQLGYNGAHNIEAYISAIGPFLKSIEQNPSTYKTLWSVCLWRSDMHCGSGHSLQDALRCALLACLEHPELEPHYW
jgi:hypothetical protein